MNESTEWKVQYVQHSLNRSDSVIYLEWTYNTQIKKKRILFPPFMSLQSQIGIMLVHLFSGKCRWLAYII